MDSPQRWLDSLQGWMNSLQGWIDSLQGWMDSLQGWIDSLQGWMDSYLSGLLVGALPSPMDGPSKTKKCLYLGCEPVAKPTGTEVVNTAIEHLLNVTSRSAHSLLCLTAPHCCNEDLTSAYALCRLSVSFITVTTGLPNEWNSYSL